MAWLELLLAGVLEVFWSTTMKWSEGFTKINFTIYTIIGMIASFSFVASNQTTANEFLLPYLDWDRCGGFSHHWCGIVP